MSLFFLSVSCFALTASSLSAQAIILDEVMSKEEQHKMGIDRLSVHQRLQLETWLNNTFVLKAQGTPKASNLSLSINIDNGQKLQLSDNSIWEVSPNDVQTSTVWVLPFPVQIEPNNDPNYPYTITNVNSGASVKARKVTANALAP